MNDDELELLFINLCLTRTNTSWIGYIDWEGNPIENPDFLPGHFLLTTKKNIRRHVEYLSYYVSDKYKYLVERRLSGRPNRYSYVEKKKTKLELLILMAEK